MHFNTSNVDDFNLSTIRMNAGQIAWLAKILKGGEWKIDGDLRVTYVESEHHRIQLAQNLETMKFHLYVW